MKKNLMQKLLLGVASATLLTSCGRFTPANPGPKGPQGDTGAKGENGNNAPSVYEEYIAQHPEYIGDEEQWMDDLIHGRLTGGNIENLDGYIIGDIIGQGIYLIHYFGSEEEIVVPTSYKGSPIIGLMEACFSGTAVRKITWTSHWKEIPEGACSECESLEEVVLEEGIESIDDYAFDDCYMLKTINFPSTLTYIGDSAFAYTGIEEIEIPETVTYVGDRAFADCEELTSISFPSELEYFGERMLSYTTNLQTVILPTNLEQISDGCFESSGITELPTLSGVTKFGTYAFSRCQNLTILDLPEGLESIGNSAFSDCPNIQTVNFPSTLKTIGSYAFERATGLKEIILPDSLVSMDYGSFANCSSVEKIDTGNGVTTIPTSCFQYSSATEIIIGSSVTSLGMSCFSNDNCLEEIVIPGNVKQIERSFMDCNSLAKVVIEDGVFNIGEWSFSGAILNEVYIPLSVQVIGYYAFPCNLYDGQKHIFCAATTTPSGWDHSWTNNTDIVEWGYTA